MTATSTTLPDAFDDNPQWQNFRKALTDRLGSLRLNWEVATRRGDVRGEDLRSYRVFDCQGSHVGEVLVQGHGPNGFEIYPALKAGRFDDILDALDIGEPAPAPAA